MRVFLSAIIFCLPVALFAFDAEKMDTQTAQDEATVMLDQADMDQLNLTDGSADEHRRRHHRHHGHGFGYGGWGYGGWGGIYPYFGGYGWPYLYPYYTGLYW